MGPEEERVERVCAAHQETGDAGAARRPRHGRLHRRGAAAPGVRGMVGGAAPTAGKAGAGQRKASRVALRRTMPGCLRSLWSR